MDLSIIIPCYNEVENVSLLERELLPVLLEQGKQGSVEVVFVDDGSIDGTHEALSKAFSGLNNDDLTFIFKQHVGNWGLGKALMTGFEASTGEVIVTLDSDGTYRYATLSTLLSYLTPEVDIVTGSPYHPDGEVEGVPEHRLVLSRGSSLIYRILVAWNVHTYTCLFRAYRRRVVEDIDFVSHSFLAGTEMLVKGLFKGYRVVEFPTTLYVRSYGVSKAKLLRTILAHLRFQFCVLLHRLHLITLVETNRERRAQPLFRTKYSPRGEE